MVEFGIVIIILIPMLFGTVAFGVNLGNWLQSTQITRDVSHLYARGIDFSLTANKNLAVALVQGMGGMTVDGGNGVLILSQIREVYQADCDAAGLSGSCNNLGKRVFSHRIVIGNSSMRTSNFGTPPAGLVSAGGDISSSDYLQKSSLVASNFDDSLLPQADGDVAFVVESFFATPDLSFLGWGANGTSGSYSRSIF